MKLRFLWCKALFVFVLFSTPFFAFAADPLVQCGNTAGLTDGAPGSAEHTNYIKALTSCNLCSVAQLAQNIVNFLIGITIPIAVCMFAWAGIMYFTNAGNETRVKDAKKIFTNVFIGFVIALCGWLLVQTILSTLVRDDLWIGGSWNNLNCVEEIGTDSGKRRIGTTVSDFLSLLPGVMSTGGGGDGSTDTTGDGGGGDDAATYTCPDGCAYNSASRMCEYEDDSSCGEPTKDAGDGGGGDDDTSTGGDYCSTHSNVGCTDARRIFNIKNNGYVADDYAAKLDELFYEMVDLDMNVNGVTITEACPTTSTHKSSCHNTCTCTDVSYTGDLSEFETAADNVGMCAVYEVPSGDSCPSGLARCIEVSWATGRHFSLYQYPGQSSSCK